VISRESIEEGKLPEEIIDISKIANIGNLLSLYLIGIFEKNPRPSIREFLESDDFRLGYFRLEMGEVGVEEVHERVESF
jgi:hypothetical protein